MTTNKHTPYEAHTTKDTVKQKSKAVLLQAMEVLGGKVGVTLTHS
jgi:hypothetical protein